MGSRSRDGGGGSAGGPVAELSLPRFAILTAVPTATEQRFTKRLQPMQCIFTEQSRGRQAAKRMYTQCTRLQRGYHPGAAAALRVAAAPAVTMLLKNRDAPVH